LPYVIVRPGGLLDAPGGTSPIVIGQVCAERAGSLQAYAQMRTFTVTSDSVSIDRLIVCCHVMLKCLHYVAARDIVITAAVRLSYARN
jgi:hypothetical protein